MNPGSIIGIVIGGILGVGLLYKAKNYIIDSQAHNGEAFNRYQWSPNKRNPSSDSGYFSAEDQPSGGRINKTKKQNKKTKRKKYNNNI